MKIDLSTQKIRAPVKAEDLSFLLGGIQPGNTVVQQLPLALLDPYPNQPFKPYPRERLELLATDIAANGVLSPIIVRPKGVRYEILAGHNRCAASRLAAQETVPGMVVDADNDTAALIMVSTNLNQREKLLPSEKAFAYRLQMDVMRRRAGRPANNSRQHVVNLASADIVGKEVGESGRQIQRYMRLTSLVADLLAQVDAGELALIPAVALSYLTHDEQALVLEVSADCNRKISVVQAEQLKKVSGQLDEDTIRSILLPSKQWSPQQEFISQSRAMIPKTASTAEVIAVLQLIENYFSERAG